jgi:hypothetical protein
MNPAITRAQPAPLDIIGTQIRADEHGRFSLNDLHLAGGGLPRNRPSLWMRNDQFKGLVVELERQGAESCFAPVKRQHGGIGGSSTYVCRELVIAYAMWVSPAFMLKGIRAFDGLQQQAQHEAALQHQQLAQLAMALQGGKSEASLCGKVLGKWGKRRRTLVERIEALERVLQLTLDGIEPVAASARLQ